MPVHEMLREELKPEFSFSLTDCNSKAKEPSLSWEENEWIPVFSEKISAESIIRDLNAYMYACMYVWRKLRAVFNKS